MACAVALAEAAVEVDLYESRPFLGGRATSYEIPSANETKEEIDNCQHVLLGCCVNLIDFYRRLGVDGLIDWHRTYYYLEPGGRRSVLKAGWLPPPLHFTGSFLGLNFLGFNDKVAIARAMAAIRWEYGRRKDLDRITMADWLREKKQTPRAIGRFWAPVLVSAVNEEPERMAASHGLQVFRLGFLEGAAASAMGLPRVTLGQLYSSDAWKRYPNARIHMKHGVSEVDPSAITVLAVPFERAAQLAPHIGLSFEGWEHSPITGIHLWFDRPVTDLPHAALLDRTIQWFFNKHEGRYLQLVVSASRALNETSRGEVFEMARTELAEFLPEAATARLEKYHVVKEIRATFSAKPGLQRPAALTTDPNLYLAGDWTDTGWPATMEGAVRSGYKAAEAVLDRLGTPKKFLIPDPC
jgi:squalene-associated FAD-dependent desaturase